MTWLQPTGPNPNVTLDATTQRLVMAARHPPYLYEMGPTDGRAALTEMQSAPVPPGVRHRLIDVPTRAGSVRAHLLSPDRAPGDVYPGPPPPVVVYAHGGGWSIGDYRSHARFARQVARQSGLPLLLVEYGLTPENRYPFAVHQLADVVTWVARGELGSTVEASRIGLLGDCAGATMAAAVALCAVDTPPVRALAMLYPFSHPGDGDADGNSNFRAFADGYALRLADVEHLWREYVPRPSARAELGAAPLSASAESAVALPPTLIITAEADVTRDPAERFAARMRAAGAAVTCVRYLGVVHDFAVLDALARTAPARSAITQTALFLGETLAPAVRSGWSSTTTPGSA